MTIENLTKSIDELKSLENVTTEIIGHSVLGRPIYAFHIGPDDDRPIIVTGAIHAREWITALLLIELVKETAARPPEHPIWFIPLCNPDGVEIALTRDPLWKANARGVDLNVNFDAAWGMGAQNVTTPGPANYIGPYPESEPETRALINFTRRTNPRLTLAYHSKGEVIYYGFNPLTRARDAEIAAKIGAITGYEPIVTTNSAGGYTDWVSATLAVPAFTIEVGNDALPHPIDVDQLPEILAQNRMVLKLFND